MGRGWPKIDIKILKFSQNLGNYIYTIKQLQTVKLLALQPNLLQKKISALKLGKKQKIRNILKEL